MTRMPGLQKRPHIPVKVAGRGGAGVLHHEISRQEGQSHRVAVLVVVRVGLGPEILVDGPSSGDQAQYIRPQHAAGQSPGVDIEVSARRQVRAFGLRLGYAAGDGRALQTGRHQPSAVLDAQGLKDLRVKLLGVKVQQAARLSVDTMQLQVGSPFPSTRQRPLP